MRAYTNVVFDNAETGVLKRAGDHLRVAFPDVDQPLPPKREDRTADNDARILLQLVRDRT